MVKKPILQLKNLSKKFGQYTVIDDISFEVGEGEIVGLLGPNGAGKTTTINMLLGVLTPTAGEIRYFNKEFTTHREEILKQINFCSSYIRLPWRLTVEENLSVIARLYEVQNRQEKIDQLLQTFEMTEYKTTAMSSLSAGQTMRVILAKAFLNSPKILLLDEPTASLDPDVAQKVRDFLLKQQKESKTTMLITSHNMAEVEQLCDRVIFLSQGKILAEDTPEELAKKIDVCHVDLLIGSKVEEAEELLAQKNWAVGIDGKYLKVELVEKDIAELLSTLAKAHIDYKEISIDKPDLEDFFIKMASLSHQESGTLI